MDYKKLWERWVGLTLLSEDDRRDLVGQLHEEVTSGVQALGTLAMTEIENVLKKEQYTKTKEYMESVASVCVLAALDGYLLLLMERGINPQTSNLANQTKTAGLGATWGAGHQKDQNRSYVDKIDPIMTLMLEKIYLLRVNQALSLHPDIVELPYKTTEKLHQYIGWCVYQGYVMGVMEAEYA